MDGICFLLQKKIKMPNKKQTSKSGASKSVASKSVASKSSKQLRYDRTSKTSNTIAASALSQMRRR